jgi:hypothetical protein
MSTQAYPTGLSSILASASWPAHQPPIDICGSGMAPAWRRFGGRDAPAQKSAETRNSCGKKDTASLPQCATGI